MQGWLSIDRDVDKANEFYRRCEKSNQAYIAIRPARKFANVSLDMNSTDTVLTSEASNKVFGLFDQYRSARSQRFKKPRFPRGKRGMYIPLHNNTTFPNGEAVQTSLHRTQCG